MGKYIKRGVKRQHDIIDGILPILEKIAKIDGVKKVIPAKIFYSPNRSIRQTLKIQREIVSGFKLMAHSKGAIQEIFIAIDKTKKDKIENELKEYVEYGKINCDN